MSLPIRILMLEDSPDDALIVKNFLNGHEPFYVFEVAATKESFIYALNSWKPDIILADNSLNRFDGMDAFRCVREHFSDMPFIMVTGYVSEEFAAEIIKMGADDYILKDRLVKLQPAITAALRRKKLENEKNEAMLLLVQSEENLKAVFDSATEAFILIDTKGYITGFNKYAKFIFTRYGNRVVQVGTNILDLADVSRRQIMLDVLQKLSQGETVQYDRLFVSEGQPDCWINIAYHPIIKNDLISGICITGRNVTENKLSEQQKEFNQNNLCALINNTRDLMWSVDRNLRLITSNKAFNDMFISISGRAPVAGSDIANGAFVKERLIRFNSFYDRAFNGETFTELEHIPGPMQAWSELSFYPIHKGNEIVGTACFSKNITEKKMAEDQIRLFGERYEAVTMATSDGIWDYDFATRKTFISGPAYKQLFGYDIENQYSESGFWETRLHPEDRERVLRELAASIADTERLQSDTEYRFLKKNGEYAYVNDRYFIIRENLKPVRMLGAIRDITAKKNIDEELRKNYQEKEMLAERLTSILSTLPASIALLDQDGGIVEVNESWKKLAGIRGYAGSGYCINNNYLTVLNKAETPAPEERKIIADGIRDILTNKIKVFEYEYSGKQGKSQKWYRMIATPLNENKYSGAVIMHLDISVIRQFEENRYWAILEDQRKITRAVLQAQEHERTRLGRELHDNISQLLAAVKMKLGSCLVGSGKNLPVLTECITYVQEAMTEARNLSHKMVLPHFAENGFQESLNMLISHYDRTDRKVELFVNILHDEMISAEIKETLYRVLQEQLNNIEKHAKASNVVIEIDAQENRIQMEINDNGIGFNDKTKGKGIGIKNIFNRIRSFNGSAVILSDPGKGFTLKVDIPVVYSQEFLNT